MTFEELYNRLPESRRFKLQVCRQTKEYHPEGVVENHLRLVFEAVKEKYGEDIDLLIAAILHDCGKPECTVQKRKNGELRFPSIGHEYQSLRLAGRYIKRYKDLKPNRAKIMEIIKHHMRAHLYRDGRLKKEHKRKAFEELKYFEDIMRFSECDEKRK